MLLPSFVGVVADRSAPLLLQASLRATVILALAGIAALCLRRASAALRHCVWFYALVGLLVTPLLAGTLPGWNILPSTTRAVALAASPVVATPTPTDLQNNHSTGSSTSPLPPSPRQPSSPTPAPAASVSVAQQPSPSPRPTLPLTFWAMLLWLLGTSLILLLVFLGHLSLAILQRRCKKIPAAEAAGHLASLQKQLHMHCPVTLLSSPRRSMPMTWGLFRPRILLPADADLWPVEKRDAVLLHELAHIRRHDCAAQLVAQLACALYWFHPLVWIAWRRMLVERERACDDLVLNTGARASAYAQHLLKSAAALPALTFVGAAAAIARPSTLEERLRAILDPHHNRSAPTMKTTAAAVVVAFAALVPVAMVHGQESFAPTPSSPSPSEHAPAASRLTSAGIGKRLGLSRPSSDIDSPACAFDAMIYEVRLPIDALATINLADFEKTTTPVEFQKALQALGDCKLLYRANQSVRLNKDQITVGSQVPVITNSQQTTHGAVNSVSYQNAGAIFDIVGRDFPGTGINLNLDIQVSSVGDGGTPISENVKAPVFHTDTLAYKGMAKANQPFYIVASDAATRDDKDRATAYIARVALGSPQTPPASVPPISDVGQ